MIPHTQYLLLRRLFPNFREYNDQFLNRHRVVSLKYHGLFDVCPCSFLHCLKDPPIQWLMLICHACIYEFDVNSKRFRQLLHITLVVCGVQIPVMGHQLVL
jgi:hypothetical protein